MRDKATDETRDPLPGRTTGRHRAPPARALSPESIRQVAEHHDLRTAATLRDALAMVQDATPQDVIFITGSLFLVAEAREILVL
jgi:folylpolyglutamate synthase/dihydropteroate synthase